MVGNLPNRMSKDDLVLLFQRFGEIVNVEIVDRYANVEFKHIVEASNAIRSLDGYNLHGKLLTVEYDDDEEEEDEDEEEEEEEDDSNEKEAQNDSNENENVNEES